MLALPASMGSVRLASFQPYDMTFRHLQFGNLSTFQKIQDSIEHRANPQHLCAFRVPLNFTLKCQLLRCLIGGGRGRDLHDRGHGHGRDRVPGLTTVSQDKKSWSKAKGGWKPYDLKNRCMQLCVISDIQSRFLHVKLYFIIVRRIHVSKGFWSSSYSQCLFNCVQLFDIDVQSPLDS